MLFIESDKGWISVGAEYGMVSKENNTPSEKQSIETHNQDPKSALFQLNARYIAERTDGEPIAGSTRPRPRDRGPEDIGY